MGIDPSLLAEIQARRLVEPGRNTLAVSSAIRRMGIKGGTLPLIPQTNWDPVVVMGQLNNLTSEPFEARGFIGLSTGPGAPGRRTVLQLSAVGGGGLVVEVLRTSDLTDPTGRVFLSISSNPFPFAVPFTTDILDIGGLPTKARSNFEFIVAAPPAGSIVLAAGAPLLNIRAVVPGGTHLVLTPRDDTRGLAAEIIWRELEDAPGAP